jgi:hypothetical protein
LLVSLTFETVQIHSLLFNFQDKMAFFNGDEGRFLSTKEAHEFKETYRKNKLSRGLADEEFVRSEFFGIDQIKALLLNKDGVAGMRVYHAKRWEDKQGNPVKEGTGRLTPRAVLVAVDKNGKDLINLRQAGLKDGSGGGGDQLADGPVCPPNCHPPSA